MARSIFRVGFRQPLVAQEESFDQDDDADPDQNQRADDSPGDIYFLDDDGDDGNAPEQSQGADGSPADARQGCRLAERVGGGVPGLCRYSVRLYHPGLGHGFRLQACADWPRKEPSDGNVLHPG